MNLIIICVKPRSLGFANGKSKKAPTSAVPHPKLEVIETDG